MLLLFDVVKLIPLSLLSAAAAGVAHRLHGKHGKNVVLLGEGCQAVRVGGYAHGIVFSGKELKADELFEVNRHPFSISPHVLLSFGKESVCAPAGADRRGGRAVERLAARGPDHAGAAGSAVLSAVGPLPLPAAAPHQGHLAAVRLRGPPQRSAAAPELLQLAGPPDGKLQCTSQSEAAEGRHVRHRDFTLGVKLFFGIFWPIQSIFIDNNNNYY